MFRTIAHNAKVFGNVATAPPFRIRVTCAASHKGNGVTQVVEVRLVIAYAVLLKKPCLILNFYLRRFDYLRVFGYVRSD